MDWDTFQCFPEVGICAILKAACGSSSWSAEITPGDGKPKPVAFPAPQEVSVERQGIHYLGLPSLIELKLASGMSPGRRRDLGDVQELIRILNLPEDFTEQLNPFVHDVYRELWAELQ